MLYFTGFVEFSSDMCLGEGGKGGGTADVKWADRVVRFFLLPDGAILLMLVSKSIWKGPEASTAASQSGKSRTGGVDNLARKPCTHNYIPFGRKTMFYCLLQR